MRGIVDFPLAGDGLVIHFPASALLELEKEYGSGDAWAVIETRLANASAQVTAKCLSIGLRRMNGNRTVPANIDPDDWNFSIQEAVVPILDALCLSYFGTDYLKQIEIAQERQAQEDLAAAKRVAELQGGEKDTDPLADSSEPNA